MNSGVNLRLELGIDAQRFVQQVQINNIRIEELIEIGIEKAFEELDDETLVNMVKAQVKFQIEEIAKNAVGYPNKWDVKWNLTTKIQDKISEKLDAYADKIAEKLTKELEL